jgi:hypothetical protein
MVIMTVMVAGINVASLVVVDTAHESEYVTHLNMEESHVVELHKKPNRVELILVQVKRTQYFSMLIP